MVAIEHCQISTVAGTLVTTTITPTPIYSNNDLTTGVPSDILSPITPTSPASSSTTISSTTATSVTNVQQKLITSTSLKMSSKALTTSHDNINTDNDDDDNYNDNNDVHKETIATTTIKNKNNNDLIKKKSATSERNVDIDISSKSINNKDIVKTSTRELSKKNLKLELKAQQSQDLDLQSPKSPVTARLSHQTSLASSVDVEDRKTLREALYQGIFSRHRRTIFAFGSFLRLLRSRTSPQYNTIRSSTEGENEGEDEVNSRR